MLLRTAEANTECFVPNILFLKSPFIFLTTLKEGSLLTSLQHGKSEEVTLQGHSTVIEQDLRAGPESEACALSQDTQLITCSTWLGL